MIEEWKDVAQKPGYSVSSLGRFRGKSGNILAGTLSKPGYIRLTRFCPDRRRNVFLHRLVAEAFIGEIPAGMEVNHKNGIKSDNRVENLEIITRTQNAKHMYDVLGVKATNPNPCKGERNGWSKFTDKDIVLMRELAEQGVRQACIARQFKTAQTVVSRIVSRQSWKHVP